MILFAMLLVPFLIAHVSAVYVGWPMNEQLPNVARVGQPYSFTLADTTYKSSAGGVITYSVENLPSWLKFEQSSRTFTGTPSKEDIKTFEIALIGTDSADNSVYNASYSMLVSDNTGFSLSSADVLFTEIAKYGNTNGVDGLVLSQGEQFSIEFSESTFKKNTGANLPIIAYYGRSGDRTSLPNWMHFNADSRTFSGTVPYVASNIAPSMVYTFAFIGSDYTGFTGVEGVFKLLVGAHSLSTSFKESIKINGTYGSKFDYTVPVFSDVLLDNSPISRDNISSVTTTSLPPYVSFDVETYSLSGTFPHQSSFQNFTVVVTDVFGDSVSLPYSFDSLDSVFTVKSLQDVNATRGEYFSYQILRSYFTDINDTSVDVSFGNDGSWLSYHDSNMTINGETPFDLKSVSVVINAKSSFGSDSRSFNIVGVDKIVTSSSSFSSSSSSSSLSSSSSSNSVSITSSISTSSTASTASSTTSSTTPTLSGPIINKSANNHKKMVVGLAVGVPSAVLLVVALLLFFCCCRGKRNPKDDESHPEEKHESKITGPGFGRIDKNDDHDETAKQLGALNLLKLENDNIKSTSSSMTHVEPNSTDKFMFPEKPLVSWRANEASDSKNVKMSLGPLRPESGASMSTVNTEQLYSVRLVEDSSSMRDSASTGGFPNNRSFSIGDGNLANVQKLDSDGNVVDDVFTNISPKSRRDSVAETILQNITEEDHKNTVSEDKLFDEKMLNEFLDSSVNAASDVTSIYMKGENTLQDYSLSGEKWESSMNGVLLPSPDTESFLLEEDTLNREGLYLNGIKEVVLTRSSIYTDSSLGNVAGDEKSEGNLVKLVNFTRKGSLRDSSRQQSVEHSADQAQIFDESE